LGTSYYYTRIVHNTAVQSTHQTVLFVGLKYKVSYCVNTHTMALGSTQPVTEMSTRNIPQGWRRPVRRDDKLTTFVCRWSWNLGASTFWNPQDLSRPVRGL